MTRGRETYSFDPTTPKYKDLSDAEFKRYSKRNDKAKKEIKELEDALAAAYAAMQKYNYDNWDKVNAATKAGTDKYFNLTSDWVAQTNKKIGELNWAGMVPPSVSGVAPSQPSDNTWRGRFSKTVAKTGLGAAIVTGKQIGRAHV